MKNRLLQLKNRISSTKFAIVLLLLLALLIAVGTVIESHFDAELAKKLVYHSWPMYVVWTLLGMSLLAAAINRWPWTSFHIPFLLAHFGIILLLLGALVTHYYGIDASMRFALGQTQREVQLSEKEVVVYWGDGQQTYFKSFSREVDFMFNSPKDQPLQIPMGEKKLEVIDFTANGMGGVKYISTDLPEAPPAIEVEIMSEKFQTTEWLKLNSLQDVAEFTLGPARIIFSLKAIEPHGGSELHLWPLDDQHVSYRLFNQGTETKSDSLTLGEDLATGWMDFAVRLKTILPHVVEQWEVVPMDQLHPGGFEAIKIKWNNKEEWLPLNQTVEFFDENKQYRVFYGNKKIDLGFALKLINFEVGRYPGSLRPSSYASTVEAEGLSGGIEISMNNPLSYRGYTFYQSSYEEGDGGEPIASILSVNKDPGRWVKYLGSALIVMGSILLFYRNRKRFLKVPK